MNVTKNGKLKQSSKELKGLASAVLHIHPEAAPPEQGEGMVVENCGHLKPPI